MADNLTHLDSDGRVNMVDISDKADTDRVAVATGRIMVSAETLTLALSGKTKKGDPLAVAELAGVMAVKRTADLIPLCHPLPVTGAKVTIEPVEGANALHVTARVKTTGKTGVEMEALTAASVACLTLYDMLKAVDKAMVIGQIELLEKSGGKSGDYTKSTDD